jgi:hypothetical protein
MPKLTIIRAVSPVSCLCHFVQAEMLIWNPYHKRDLITRHALCCKVKVLTKYTKPSSMIN